MTDKYAVIGNPIAHSKSPEIHTMFAEQFKDQPAGDMAYKDRILAPLDGFAATVERLCKEGYKGCNVTVPFKFEAYKLATQWNERAQIAQAVNTLKFNGDEILGDNTDGAGLVTDIERNLGIALHDKNVLLMGAGGAAWGVVLPLIDADSRVVVANRTAEKAQQLASTLETHGNVSGCGYDELGSLQFDIVINATSAGLTDSEIPLPETIFAPGALAYDMMYGRETPFMKFAREHGARVADGLGMLVEQAAEAFFIWRGVRPDTAPVIAALRNR